MISSIKQLIFLIFEKKTKQNVTKSILYLQSIIDMSREDFEPFFNYSITYVKCEIHHASETMNFFYFC